MIIGGKFYAVIKNDGRTAMSFPWRVAYTVGGKSKAVTSKFTKDHRERIQATFKNRGDAIAHLAAMKSGDKDFTCMD